MLITATFYVMGINLNTLKTSHDSVISIAVIAIDVVKVSERVSHVTCSDFICKHVSQSQQWAVTLNPTETRPFKQSVQIRG